MVTKNKNKTKKQNVKKIFWTNQLIANLNQKSTNFTNEFYQEIFKKFRKINLDDQNPNSPI